MSGGCLLKLLLAAFNFLTDLVTAEKPKSADKKRAQKKLLKSNKARK